MSKLTVRDLRDSRTLDQSMMKEAVGGKEKLYYIFSAETLKILGASDATVSARKAEEDALEATNNVFGR